jgi:hypothetical protein
MAYSKVNVCIQHRTEALTTTTWRNLVWLVNKSTSAWNLVYTSPTYTASVSDQKDPGIGWWGPIIEVFQSSFTSATNVLGFHNTSLSAIDSSWNSSGMSFLYDTQSDMYNDGYGFTEQFRSPNYSWGAKV